MLKKNGKTIQIFLPSGEPRGIRMAEITTRIVKAVLIPRSELSTAKSLPELDHPSVYFLFSDSEEEAKPNVYIGQTEDVQKRLYSHNSTKDFWQTAILVISQTKSFTQAHIKYLEHYCVKKGKEVCRYNVINDQTPSKPHVTEPMKADLHDAFDMLSTLLSTLGYPVFESYSKGKAAEQYCIKKKDADATGELAENGFVVRAGSMARLKVVKSAQKTIPPIQELLQKSGVLVKEGKHLRFTQDYLFKSPSGAASLVLGRGATGLDEWKNKDGLSLNQLKVEGTAKK